MLKIISDLNDLKITISKEKVMILGEIVKKLIKRNEVFFSPSIGCSELKKINICENNNIITPIKHKRNSQYNTYDNEFLPNIFILKYFNYCLTITNVY